MTPLRTAGTWQGMWIHLLQAVPEHVASPAAKSICPSTCVAAPSDRPLLSSGPRRAVSSGSQLYTVGLRRMNERMTCLIHSFIHSAIYSRRREAGVFLYLSRMRSASVVCFFSLAALATRGCQGLWMGRDESMSPRKCTGTQSQASFSRFSTLAVRSHFCVCADAIDL
ncbi:unnamed protein product [Periconia digitata]|uniref:Uncharacterized protein n=1 Tax=Periconia digitata TaxID=1303443 RepID=A0A9W4U312_9PLEO|nr:unnamed protein product [Periconia digitata]